MLAATTMSMAAAATTAEELLLRGKFAQALAESQRRLAQRTLELRQELREAGEEPRTVPCITPDEERVLSVYLQSIFELDADAEVETATAIADAFAPLPTTVAVQWVTFLVAMQRRSTAEKYLRHAINSLRVELESDPDNEDATSRHTTLLELLAVEFVLEEEGQAAALGLVRDYPTLDDIIRLRLVGRIEERSAVAPDTSSSTTAASNATSNPSSSMTTTASTSVGCGSDSPTPEAEDCSYALVGGAALAVAVAAVGVVQYRDKIHEAFSQVAPAISKGIADAKYALFDV